MAYILGLMLALTSLPTSALDLVLPKSIPESIPVESAPIQTDHIEAKKEVAVDEKIDLGLPVRLKIPGIDVNSAIVYFGLNSNGTIETSKEPSEVAWFNLGPRPGATGNAVISGHNGWKNNTPAVFDNLQALRKGDKVYVEDGHGSSTAFIVNESRRYDPHADDSDIFRSTDGKSHLNLITCQGAWDQTDENYSHRLVIFTDKETE